MNTKHVGLHSTFPTLILSFEDFLSEQQRNDILHYTRNNELKAHPSLTESKGGSNYSLVSDVITDISKSYVSCSSLCFDIQDAISMYCQKAGWVNVILSNSWTSTQYAGSELKTHMHPGSVVSGVIYIQADDQSSPIYFTNPNPYLDFTMTDTDTEFSNSWYKFNPKTALMLLFPSWMKHGSNRELSQSDERVILSFNSIVRQYK